MEKKSLKKYFENKEKTCKEYQKTFGDYIEEKLSLEDEHLLVLHVKKCKECMEELEATYMFASAFKFLEDNDDDEGIRTDIKDLLKKSEEEYNYVKRHNITLIVEIITTAVLIGVIIAFFINADIREMLLWGK
ncbi:MAG: zf-HC2 domain-containing protein [Lachnospiraceae bacterium]|nr:zf-HC2 domain-containing protein [Lachnospiraceae bacterium]